MTKEVAKVKNENNVVNIEQLISQAISKDVDVDKLERILKMRDAMKKEWAKEQFDIAMSNFQKECPIIKKDKKARDDNKNKDLYSYASLGYMVAKTKDLISNNGLSFTFNTENGTDRVKVTCIVKHISGHEERSVMETSLSTKTNIMSNPQQIAATVSFNKRYAFKNAFGIVEQDEDNEELLNQIITGVMEDIKNIKTLEELKAYHKANQKKYHSIEYNKAIVNKQNELKNL